MSILTFGIANPAISSYSAQTGLLTVSAAPTYHQINSGGLKPIAKPKSVQFEAGFSEGGVFNAESDTNFSLFGGINGHTGLILSGKVSDAFYVDVEGSFHDTLNVTITNLTGALKEDYPDIEQLQINMTILNIVGANGQFLLQNDFSANWSSNSANGAAYSIP